MDDIGEPGGGGGKGGRGEGVKGNELDESASDTLCFTSFIGIETFGVYVWCCAVYRFRRRNTALDRRRLGAAYCAVYETNALKRVAASYARCTKTRVTWLIDRLLIKLNFLLSSLFSCYVFLQKKKKK